MKRILVLFAVLSVGSAAAAEIRTYKVRVAAQESGPSLGSAFLSVADARPGELTVPLGFKGVGDVRVTTGPAGTSVTTAKRNGRESLTFTLPPGSPRQLELGVAFTVADVFETPKPARGEKSTLPAGARLFRHALVNSQDDVIGEYQAEVVFPNALRAHAIREALPKPGKKEAEPRVRLDAIDGGAGARLRAAHLGQGDSTSMQIELVPRSRSAGWLLAGLVLSVLYLVQFRDLVATSARGTTQEK